MFGFVEFFDAAFIRLAWALIVDYLVASGYLLPEQRQQWVDGYVHIASAIGAILFIAIWMHHSNSKESANGFKTTTTSVTTTSDMGSRLLAGLKNFVIKEKTTTTTEPSNPHGITHLPTETETTP